MIVKNLSRIKDFNQRNISLNEEYPKSSIVIILILVILIAICLIFSYFLGLGETDSLTKGIRILFFIPVIVFSIFILIIILSAFYRTTLLITESELIITFYFIILPIKTKRFKKDFFKIHFFDRSTMTASISFEKQFAYLISLISNDERMIIRYYNNTLTDKDIDYVELLQAHNLKLDDSTRKLLLQ